MKNFTQTNFAVLLAFFLSFIAIATTYAQGTVQDSVVLKSTILKKNMRMRVYLPQNYSTMQERLPVLYLLHGMGQNYKDWVRFGKADSTANLLIKEGKMKPMIIVMPDAGNTFFVNSAEGYHYEDYFFKELIPYIDSTYKTRPSREYRAIAGLSMGGYGSILYSLKHANIFSACVGLSCGIVTDEEIINIPENVWDAYYAPLFGKASGKDRLQLDIWKSNSTLSLFQQGKKEDLIATKWYFDIGDDDSLYKGNTALHNILSDKQIPHEFRMRDGSHTWDYWRSVLADALTFIDKELKQ